MLHRKLKPERLGKLSEVFQLQREGTQVARGSRSPHLEVPAERSWQSSIQLGSHNPKESSSEDHLIYVSVLVARVYSPYVEDTFFSNDLVFVSPG